MTSAQVLLASRIAGAGLALALAVGVANVNSLGGGANLTAGSEVAPSPTGTASVPASVSPSPSASVTPTATATPAASTTATPTAAPTASVVPVPAPVLKTKIVVITQRIAFRNRIVKDKNLAVGKKKVTRAGHSGYRQRIYTYTYRDGRVVKRVLVKIRVTRSPIDQITHIGTKKPSASKCDPNYSGACVPIASDVDCANGNGNGPAYVAGPVKVIGKDIYGLDGDKNGVGCQ
jgi:resuscitation-promoting factor RpfB